MVIVAAGASRRMAGTDKLEADVLGRPLLAWTVDRMRAAACTRQVVLVVAAGQLRHYQTLPWLQRRDVLLVAGGEQRSQSVQAGLERARGELVLVHDGARPLATARLADAVAKAAQAQGAALPILPVVDSLKRVSQGRVTGAVERNGLGRAQTPQGARRQLLLEAFAAAGDTAYPDEASLLESNGVDVAAVPGEAGNIKVTEVADLGIVRALAAAQAGSSTARQGTAVDSHPFGPDDGLWLGGLLLEEAPRLYGHSDGDVALHALGSALLGAAGMGDLGSLFPRGEPETRNAPSSALLSRVLEQIEQAGFRVSAAQLTLVGARPRLGAARLEEMRRQMAGLLGLTTAAFSLTASTGNLTGPEGAGLVISASASVSLLPAQL